MTDPHNENSDGKDAHIWDDPKNVSILLYCLYALCAVVVIPDLFAAAELFYVKKIHFKAEEIPAAYSFYGFLCFVFIVFAGKVLRMVVMRDEDYYDR